ncbi:MAG: hypothetical protein E3J52_10450 [Promethearchaeota archaeon]|nr:MAG: hypothetical protein E3J52_10450 [Candidatus Lokiarchaeota archaeon]
MIKQQRLGLSKETKLNKEYSYGSYNKFNNYEQWIRLTEGCPHNCPYCYEPTEYRIFGIPDIVRTKVKIMDMNLLSKQESLEIIEELGKKRVNNKTVNYELICGLDYRYLNRENSIALKRSRFRNIRLAWDWYFKDQYKIKDSIDLLIKAGYKSKDIMVFMICNWKINYSENIKKLDLCKVWNVKVSDCYFDGQVSPNVNPIHWTIEEIKKFRKKVRKHNQLVNFRIDPEIK